MRTMLPYKERVNRRHKMLALTDQGYRSEEIAIMLGTHKNRVWEALKNSKNLCGNNCPICKGKSVRPGVTENISISRQALKDLLEQTFLAGYKTAITN